MDDWTVGRGFLFLFPRVEDIKDPRVGSQTVSLLSATHSLQGPLGRLPGGRRLSTRTGGDTRCLVSIFGRFGLSSRGREGKTYVITLVKEFSFWSPLTSNLFIWRKSDYN